MALGFDTAKAAMVMTLVAPRIANPDYQALGRVISAVIRERAEDGVASLASEAEERYRRGNE